MAGDPEVLFTRRGAAGLVTLNRPHALNAVTHGMVRALRQQLDAWADDPAVTRVVVTAAGDRAFSAGGDIRALYDLAQARRHAEALAFWHDEYRLNALIKRYPKPYVALINGIVMGGGVGVSIHGSHRVAGEKFLFAMPEVGIGFFPDVGATWFLPRMPGRIGTFCALTGERLKLGDAIATGIATHHVAAARFPDLVEALCGTVPVDAVLGAFADTPGAAPIAGRRAVIDRLLAGDRIEDVLARLDAASAANGEDAAWAGAVAATIRTKSPSSLKIAFRQMQCGAAASFDTCMQTEFRIVSRLVHGHDFYEGIRAVIIDKDNAPRWQPPRLADVADAEVERHFAPLAAELDLT